MALFELTDLAAYLQRDLDTATATVARDIATGIITGHTRQLIESATYQHVLRVSPGGVVTLPQRPVTAVTTVTTPDHGTLTADQWDWPGAGPWVTLDVTTDTATIDYTAGYATVPAPIKAVAIAVAARNYVNSDGLQSERIDDYSVTYSGTGGGLEAAEERILARYRAPSATVVPS